MGGKPPELADPNAQSLPEAVPIGPFALCLYVCAQAFFSVVFVFGIVLAVAGLFGDDPGMVRIVLLIFGPLLSIGALMKRKELRRAYGRL